MIKRKINHKNNGRGDYFPYINLPRDMVHGEEVVLEELCDGSLLIKFV